jgi:hypothetical protein
MMIKFIAAAALFMLFSCSPAKDKIVIDESLPVATNNAAPADSSLPNTLIKSNTGNATFTPPTNNQQQPVTPTVTTSTATQNSASGINPAHGQPGHRCDISVGAPLNSKPTPTAAAPATVTTTQTKAIPAPAATPTAPGMNPPHGQPGHRCDIGVGAPLNSKPAAVTTTPTEAPINAVPVKTDSSKN